jgi:hypothetical protein
MICSRAGVSWQNTNSKLFKAWVDDQPALCELRSCSGLRDRAGSPGMRREDLDAPE